MPRVLAFIKVLAGFCIRTRKAVAVISASAFWDASMSVLVLNVRNNLSGEFQTLNYVVPSIHPCMHPSTIHTYVRAYIHTVCSKSCFTEKRRVILLFYKL
jgi:hypothetical protein